MGSVAATGSAACGSGAGTVATDGAWGLTTAGPVVGFGVVLALAGLGALDAALAGAAFASGPAAASRAVATVAGFGVLPALADSVLGLPAEAFVAGAERCGFFDGAGEPLPGAGRERVLAAAGAAAEDDCLSREGRWTRFIGARKAEPPSDGRAGWLAVQGVL